jgi:hypothetical protein
VGAADSTVSTVVSGHYAAGVTDAQPRPLSSLPKLTVVSGPKRPMGRFPLAFAGLAVLIAVAAGAFVLLRGEPHEVTRTPEETVREFLAAVFLAEDPNRVAAVVCDNWVPADAVERTRAEIPRSIRVSWDEFAEVTADSQRITLRARLGLRRADDLRPTSFAQWRFHLVKQDSWRVCEARPFVA